MARSRANKVVFWLLAIGFTVALGLSVRELFKQKAASSSTVTLPILIQADGSLAIESSLLNSPNQIGTVSLSLIESRGQSVFNTTAWTKQEWRTDVVLTKGALTAPQRTAVLTKVVNAIGVSADPALLSTQPPPGMTQTSGAARQWHYGTAAFLLAFNMGVIVFVVALVAAIALLFVDRSKAAHLCPTCGYDKRGLAVGAVCPECGK